MFFEIRNYNKFKVIDFIYKIYVVILHKNKLFLVYLNTNMSETIIENGEIKKVNEPSQNESKVKEKVVTNIKNSLSLPSVSEPYFVKSDN
jgi:hypothetical protein